MKISNIYYCRECRISHHNQIKDLKNAFLERPSNVRGISSKIDMSILEDYAHKNVVKKPAHITSLSRMATEISKEWKNGRRLTISFMGGKKAVKDRIIRHAKTWMDYANIELDFTPRKTPGNVRIAFDMNDGSWSLMGTQILSEDKTNPTMNLAIHWVAFMNTNGQTMVYPGINQKCMNIIKRPMTEARKKWMNRFFQNTIYRRYVPANWIKNRS